MTLGGSYESATTGILISWCAPHVTQRLPNHYQTTTHPSAEVAEVAVSRVTLAAVLMISMMFWKHDEMTSSVAVVLITLLDRQLNWPGRPGTSAQVAAADCGQ